MENPNIRYPVAAESASEVISHAGRRSRAVSSNDRASTVGLPQCEAGTSVDGVSTDHAGPNDAANNSQSPDLYQHPSSSATARDFTIFGSLPFELRIQVWRQAMDQSPRLIELEWTDPGNATTGFISGTHEWWQVCPRSRQLPVIMQVCRESMNEGKLYLEYRLFDSDNERLPSNTKYEIYFNPRADIIFFGESTCITTMINMFSETPGMPNIPISKVAVMCSPKGEDCCDHDDPDYGVQGGVEIMEALHGFGKAVTNHDWRYGGCTGLKEVHFIVKSNLWQRQAGEIDWTVGLRPARLEGLTSEEGAIKRRLDRQTHWVKNDSGIPGTGKFAWAKKKPVFHFSSLAPVATSEEEVYDGTRVRSDYVHYLEDDNLEFVRSVERQTGCSIHLTERNSEEPLCEIGFSGSKEAVTNVKKVIEQKLNDSIPDWSGL